MKAHIWLIPVGLAVVIFGIASTKPIANPGQGEPMRRRAWVAMWSGMGILCLIVAAYFAIHGVSAHRA